MEEYEKLKKGWKYGAGAGLLKRRGGGLVLKRGEAGAFPIKYFQGLSFLHSEIILLFAKLCYAFEEKLFFSATIIL